MNWLFVSQSKICPRTSSFDYNRNHCGSPPKTCFERKNSGNLYRGCQLVLVLLLEFLKTLDVLRMRGVVHVKVAPVGVLPEGGSGELQPRKNHPHRLVEEFVAKQLVVLHRVLGDLTGFFFISDVEEVKRETNVHEAHTDILAEEIDRKITVYVLKIVERQELFEAFLKELCIPLLLVHEDQCLVHLHCNDIKDKRKRRCLSAGVEAVQPVKNKMSEAGFDAGLSLST